MSLYFYVLSSQYLVLYSEMFDVPHLIEAGGLLVIAFIVFAETGLLFGFFLPGDTLLLSAGVFASQGKLSIFAAIPVVIISAIVGNTAGYYIGKHAGKRIFSKTNGILFRHEYLDRAEKFYEAHGWKTILFARFVPIIRTFAPVIAGIGSMNEKAFLLYNVIGAVLWGGGVTLLGYWVGSRIPNIDHYILPVILLATAATFGPILYHIAKGLFTRPEK